MNDKVITELKNVHDSKVVSLQIVNETTITIGILTNNKIVNYQFLNCLKCRFDDFRIGNIILDVELYGKDDINSIECILTYVLGIRKQDYGKQFVLDVLRKIQNGEIFLLELTSSYGLRGALLFHDIASS